MSVQGIVCPKCGSRRISIVVADALTFKCMDCGYTWSPSLPAQGLVSTRAGELHWTEVKKVMEDAINYVRRLLEDGVDGCNDIISKVQEMYGKVLTTREIIKVVIISMKRYLEEIRYRDVNEYARLNSELGRCRELMAK